MPWTCRKCKRSFVARPKEHSCVKLAAADHLEGKPENLLEIYHRLEAVFSGFGDYRVEAVKTALYFKKLSTFAGIVFRKDHLRLEFFLDHEEDVFPVEKIVHYSKNRIVHTVSLSSVAEIDRQLLSWLKESYRLTR